MPSLEDSVFTWIGASRTVVCPDAFDDVTRVARAVLHDFWEAHPYHKTSVEADALQQLESIARAVGFEDASSMVGSAKIGGSGEMTLELRRKSDDYPNE